MAAMTGLVRSILVGPMGPRSIIRAATTLAKFWTKSLRLCVQFCMSQTHVVTNLFLVKVSQLIQVETSAKVSSEAVQHRTVHVVVRLKLQKHLLKGIF